ncbi:MAG: FliH/SctL family protein [Candidatus Methylumidiphilus sp.]
MSEYVRWEMQRLDIPKETQPAAFDERIERRINEAQRKAYGEGLERGMARGYEEGLAKGHQEGLAKGYEEGYGQGFAIGRSAADGACLRLSALANHFHQQLLQSDELICQDVLDLAMDIAKAMLKTALPVRPDLISGLVSEIIRESYGEQSPARLHLNPADADWIKKEFAEPLADLNWQIVANAQLEQGGCLVETATAQIDASLPTRWRRIALALGKESEWLAT